LGYLHLLRVSAEGSQFPDLPPQRFS
jgi:hypothetical protein